MEVVVREDAAAASMFVARLLADAVRAMPGIVLGLATGRTMEPVYAELGRWYREDGLDFSRCRSFNLDEYEGLAPDDPHSFHDFMRRHWIANVNVDPGRVHIPHTVAGYEQRIVAAGGIDLQLLGIGENGHVGFNEPGTPVATRTHLAVLTPETRQQNAAMFGSEDAVPNRAITVGIGTILDARRIVLLATGRAKAAAVAGMLCGEADVPAAALLAHRNCVVVLDEEARALP